MKPFSKFEAISGKPVVTRIGKKVTQLKEIELSGPYQIVGVVEGNDTVDEWTDDGSFYTDHIESVMDLFMESDVHEGWVAFGTRGLLRQAEKQQTTLGLVAFATHVWSTEAVAVESYKTANLNHEPKGTVRISWEE